ncbi:PTS sugar transporter subunit IIB [Enterococcus sp. 669A]|uniref:PTS sugar transporter subunit IIB n=1 Tax=Candidatus Enterococcus moelleringii TaxID=2815325 RepID=A0ABS3LEN2_9ENTE|nr:PTS sugar transporter subunit IIB [Enterococcus sp. 669A]MBO1308094.1 PTS sugar transporter subunit IIB [Enterococcus sp. 669A]
MGKITLARVDDRLIHGQVMTSWLQYTGARHILIIDDETANDEFTKTIISMAVPNGIQLDVFTIAEATSFLSENNFNDLILLVKSPLTFLQLIERGIPLKEIVVGGMGASAERKSFYKNISASENEKIVLKKLIDNGVEVRIQVIPDQKSVSVKNLL